MPDRIYQLKVTLRDVRPPVWRRLLVPGSATLGDLHRMIMKSMGWLDCHLHEFEVGGVRYAPPDPEADDWGLAPACDEGSARLARVAPRAGMRFDYTYDFGDDWVHSILVEAVGPVEAGRAYPACIAGRRACPPEDVGGPWGYAEFLAALADPEHEEHEDYLDWVGGFFDPAEFHLAETDEALRYVSSLTVTR
jgi:hypothetical protein